MNDLSPEGTDVKITPSGIVWFLLSIAVMIIMAMTAAWAADTNTRQTAMEGRLNTVEKQFATVVTEYEDLRDHQAQAEKKIDQLLQRRDSR